MQGALRRAGKANRARQRTFSCILIPRATSKTRSASPREIVVLGRRATLLISALAATQARRLGTIANRPRLARPVGHHRHTNRYTPRIIASELQSDFFSGSSFDHFRSLPNPGPCAASSYFSPGQCRFARAFTTRRLSSAALPYRTSQSAT